MGYAPLQEIFPTQAARIIHKIALSANPDWAGGLAWTRGACSSSHFGLNRAIGPTGPAHYEDQESTIFMAFKFRRNCIPSSTSAQPEMLTSYSRRA